MTITRMAKGIAYLVGTVLLTSISVALQTAMHTEGGLEENYFRSDLALFLIAATVMGIGVYSWISYTRRHKEHLPDSLFLTIIGLVLMMLTVFVVVSYGGMEGTFDKTGHTAVNLNIVLLSAMPLPFLIRAVILAVGAGRDNPAGRTGLLIACGMVAAAMVILAFTGGVMKLSDYDAGTAEENSSWRDDSYPEDEV